MRRAVFNSAKRSRNPAATGSIPSVAARAAANSMASGMPSSWRQIAAIVGRFSARDANVRTKLVRSGDEEFRCAVASNLVRFELVVRGHFKRRHAIGVLCPRSEASSRLVARIVVRGHRRTNISARVAAASMTCSQLSRTSRSFFPPTARATASAEWTSDPSLSPSTPATADGTRCGSDSDASSTSHPPSANSPRTRRATFNARVVFPMPPGPVRVTTR